MLLLLIQLYALKRQERHLEHRSNAFLGSEDGREASAFQACSLPHLAMLSSLCKQNTKGAFFFLKKNIRRINGGTSPCVHLFCTYTM